MVDPFKLMQQNTLPFTKTDMCNTAIVSYGSIIGIAGRRVTVCVSAHSAVNPQTIDCTFMSLCSEQFGFIIQPFVGMRVAVLALQKFHPDMFNSAEALTEVYGKPSAFSENLLHYSESGALCFPLAPDCTAVNKITIDKNIIDVEFDSVIISDYNNSITRKYHKAVAEVYEDNALVQYGDDLDVQLNGAAAVTGSEDVTVNLTTGLMQLKNNDADLGKIFDDFAQELIQGFAAMTVTAPSTGGPCTVVHTGIDNAINKFKTEIAKLIKKDS